MTRTNLASVALVLVAAFGSTGCCGAYGHARYGYRARYRHMVWVPGVAVAPPMAAPAPPPPPPAPPQPAYAAYSGGSQPIVVHTNGPATIVIVNPPGAGQPTVQYLPGHAYAPQAPAPQAPAPQPVAPAEQNPNGWGQEE